MKNNCCRAASFPVTRDPERAAAHARVVDPCGCRSNHQTIPVWAAAVFSGSRNLFPSRSPERAAFAGAFSAPASAWYDSLYRERLNPRGGGFIIIWGKIAEKLA